MQIFSLILAAFLAFPNTGLRSEVDGADISSRASASNEMVDRTFGIGGIVKTSVGPGNSSAQAVAVQPDGKVVVAGFASNGDNDDFAVVRYNRDGQLDTEFNGTGIVTTAIGSRDDAAFAIALQPDRKFVVAGQTSDGTKSSVAAVRYNPDGSLDTDFGNGGKIVISTIAGTAVARSVAIDSIGRIFIAGNAQNGATADILTICLTPNGIPDDSFDGETGEANGVVLTPVGNGSDQGYGVAVQEDDKIVVSGYFTDGATTDTLILRYSGDGRLDQTFGNHGIARHSFSSDADEALSLALAPDGKIVIGGCIRNGAPNDFLIARFLNDGTPDLDFGINGSTVIPFSSAPDLSLAVAVQSDAKIVVAGFGSNGENNDFAVARVTADGQADATFSSDGKVLTMLGDSSDFAFGVAIAPDGGIVTVGRMIGPTTQFGVVRYHPGLASISGRVVSPNGTAIRNSQVVLTDSLGFSRTVSTGSFGVFEFSEIVTGDLITVGVRSKRYRFAPQSFTLAGNLSDLELVGLQ